jgi:hypothetical protein
MYEVFIQKKSHRVFLVISEAGIGSAAQSKCSYRYTVAKFRLPDFSTQNVWV